jgi:hypothetical protein
MARHSKPNVAPNGGRKTGSGSAQNEGVTSNAAASSAQTQDPAPLPPAASAPGPGGRRSGPSGRTGGSSLRDPGSAVRPGGGVAGVAHGPKRFPGELFDRIGGSKLGVAFPTEPSRRTRDILLIQGPRQEADGFVRAAVESLREEYGGEAKIREVHQLLDSGGTEHVAKVTEKLNATGLDRTERLVLSVEGVYATIIEEALEKASTGDVGKRLKLEDTAGLLNFVRRAVSEDDGPLDKYVAALLEGALQKRGVQLHDAVKKQIRRDLRSVDIPARSSQAERVIYGVVEPWREKGLIGIAIEQYATRKEIDPSRLTIPVRRKMIDFLVGLGVTFENAQGYDEQGVDDGDYDEYFALAYQRAAAAGDGSSSDPIDAVHQKGAVVDWDFTVDPFDTVEEQGVIPQNILAAGALDYIYNLGERLGVFRLADAVVLRWGSGSIDLDPGETPAKLYRYWKLRSERTSPEERAMLYTRILNKGGGEMLEGMMANEAFPELWGGLMTAVAEYISRVEEKKTEEQSVSRQRIYQATKQLQYNLTEFTTGMAQMQISEMYHHLQEARQILEDPQVMDYFGSGRRKTIWTVIERASKEWFEYSPNIAAIRDAAVQGNKVFQWIANFDQSTVSEGDFQEFKDAAEAWILASGIDTGEEPEQATDEEKTDEDSIKIKDDFDSDWDA